MEPTKKSVRDQLRSQMLGAILAALGLVVGLAWNDAVKSLIESVFPTDGAGLPAKFIYAVILTIIVVLVSYGLMRWFQREESK